MACRPNRTGRVVCSTRTIGSTGGRSWRGSGQLLARFLPQGAILLSVLTFAAYAAGLLRDRLFARTYGAGIELDAYNAAFVLPELALDVLVAAGLTAPFVPVFSTLRDGAAARFAQTVLTLAVIVMGAMCAVLFVVAPWTVEVIAPGFDAAGRALYTELFRIMLLTPVLFAASITLGEVLVAERRFLFYALAPILYNVGIAGGTFLLHDSLGIRAAAVGAVAGAALHLSIRVAGILRSSVPLRPRLDLQLPALHEFLRLMVPKMLSHPIEPLTFLYFTRVASTLAAGSVTAVSFARNFQSVPVSLIGVSIALAAFPGLSGRLGRRRPGGLCRRDPAQRPHDRRALDDRRDRAGRGGSAGHRAAAGRRTFRRRGCPADRRRSWPRSRSRFRSTRWGTSPRGACTRPTTRCSRSGRRWPASW